MILLSDFQLPIAVATQQNKKNGTASSALLHKPHVKAPNVSLGYRSSTLTVHALEFCTREPVAKEPKLVLAGE